MSVHSHILRSYLDILNEATPAPASVPSADYKASMDKIGAKASYTPDNIAHFQQSNVKQGAVGQQPGQDLTNDNLKTIQSLIDPKAIQNYAAQVQATGRPPIDPADVTDMLKMISQYDDPRGIVKIALNSGMKPEEVLKFIPKDFSLAAAPTQESLNTENSLIVEYIEQIELEGDVHPGDGFEIEISEDTVIETTVLESWEDSILIALDNEAIKMLKESSVELITEAEYQGRSVPLGKPMKGDVKKSKVYVRKPNGKVVKVNFGDKKLSIKKHIPGRRKNFRARHNCDNPGPRWKARYWSCRAW